MKYKRLYIKARRMWHEHVEPISRDQWVIFISFLAAGIGIGMGA
jgi:hypothetical protein